MARVSLARAALLLFVMLHLRRELKLFVDDMYPDNYEAASAFIVCSNVR